MRTLTLLLLLGALTGCQSFDELRQDDRAVSEDEVHEAGLAEDEQDLTEHLHRIVEHHKEYDDDVVVAALVSLGRRGEEASVSVVAPLVADPDEEVRFQVAACLHQLGGDQADEVLARMAREDESELVRQEARRTVN